MGRPQKYTVDYFPHFVKEGKTIFILQSQYRNDGYAFWFKLLEIVSATDNHVLDVRNSADWQYLLAKTLVDEETGQKILDLLADLDAIDSKLWSIKIIWIQKLVDNFTDIYKKRGQNLPQRPVINDINSVSGNINSVSDSDNTQTKLKETKVNKEIYKEKTTDNKKPYGEFKNVLLSGEEHKKLIDKFGEARAGQLIETLSAGIDSKGYKYKNHYSTILNWARRDEKGGNNGKTNSANNGKILKPDEFTDPDEYFRQRRNEHR